MTILGPFLATICQASMVRNYKKHKDALNKKANKKVAPGSIAEYFPKLADGDPTSKLVFFQFRK